jgi:hypothetical protein
MSVFAGVIDGVIVISKTNGTYFFVAGLLTLYVALP